MLTGILEVLSRKESLSMTELAAEIGCTVRELEGALEQLERMGYVRREHLGPSCSSSCGNDQNRSQCEGCGFRSDDPLICWILTEKGQILLNNPSKN